VARTILEIAKEAAERDNTSRPLVSLFGAGNDRVARVLRIAAADTIRDILRASVGLSEFQATYVFTMEPGRYAYALPPDYLRMIPGTENRANWPMSLIGPVSPQQWARWMSGAVTSPAPSGWRIRNNALWIDPPPASRELVQIDYISRYPVVAPISSDVIDVTDGAIQVKAPMVPRDGAITENVKRALFTEEYDGTAYGDVPGWDEAVWAEEVTEILRRINLTSNVDPKPMIRKPEFTADTDRPAFDDDHLLSLGMTFRLRRGLGMPYAEQADEYEAEKEAKAFGDAGGVRDFRFGCDDDRPAVIPLGDGKWLAP
jgi:hypothetical protein